jgi:nucleoside-diphosphate-sugar epimerase
MLPRSEDRAAFLAVKRVSNGVTGSTDAIRVRNVLPAGRALIARPDDLLLVTGAGGFIGSRVLETLLASGFTNIRCLARSARSAESLARTASRWSQARVEVVDGNLLSRQVCLQLAKGTRVVYHLAAGVEKSFAGCFLNSVVTTKNLLEAIAASGGVKRFVNVSSFGVYANAGLKRQAMLDETCELETEHVWRHEPYAYAKLKQEEILVQRATRAGIPYVILRPGVVYGPGASTLTGRVGLGSFGVFLHLGGRNQIPFTYVDNCAAAIVLAGVVDGVDGQVFNVVDDELPSSVSFLRAYRRQVRPIKYIYVPYRAFYGFCHLWECYSRWSGGQLPPVFNRRKCAAYWKGNRYSNRKLKELLGWEPAVSFPHGSNAYFAYLRAAGSC